MDINGYGTPAESALPTGVTVYPAFVYRQFTTAHLLWASLLIVASLSVCCGGCYFLCCREWWCQFDVFAKFQYF